MKTSRTTSTDVTLVPSMLSVNVDIDGVIQILVNFALGYPI